MPAFPKMSADTQSSKRRPSRWRKSYSTSPATWASISSVVAAAPRQRICRPLSKPSKIWRLLSAKCSQNPTNYKDGEPCFAKVLKWQKEYGAGVFIGTIDEEEMARTAEGKFNIAKRAYDQATNKYGIPADDIFFDALALPISTGIEEDRRNALETIEGIRRIKTELQGVFTILGVSNISFGLSPASRIVLNSVFLHEAVAAGLG